jgi:hypothetical protein
MTITRKLASTIAAAAIAASAMGTFTTAASAKDWRGDRDGYRYSRSYDRYEDRDWRRHNRNRYYARHYHRDRDNTGKYIAIGVGALMLGILASQAGRH